MPSNRVLCANTNSNKNPVQEREWNKICFEFTYFKKELLFPSKNNNESKEIFQKNEKNSFSLNDFCHVVVVTCLDLDPTVFLVLFDDAHALFASVLPGKVETIEIPKQLIIMDMISAIGNLSYVDLKITLWFY